MNRRRNIVARRPVHHHCKVELHNRGHIVKQLTLMLVVVFLIPSVGSAKDSQNFQCTLRDMTRRVEIVSEPGVSVPCEVHYYKDSEAPGEQQVLWRAMNEAGYCESTAIEFIARLGEMGWQCGQAEQGAPADSDVESDDTTDDTSDDTADLAPAEDIELSDPQ
jgi:hypothetical protein